MSPTISHTLDATDAPTPARLEGPRIAPAIPLDAIADPGYEHHPAYGKAFPKPSLKLRAQALLKLAPWLIFALVKQLLLGDRIPALPRDGDGLEGGLLRRMRALPRYVPFVLGGVARQFRTRPRQSLAAASIAASCLREDGILIARFPQDRKAKLRQAVSTPLCELQARRDRVQATTFKGNQYVFTAQENPDLYRLVKDMFADQGLLEAAAAYLGREVDVTRLLLQINDPRDQYLYTCFPDVGLQNSRANYLHIDRGFGCLKCIIYLSEVGPRNGPFSYVLGTNRLDLGFLGGLVRRAVDRAGLAACDRETRRLFMALPRAVRKKSEFGSDLLDGSESSEQLLRAEVRFTSDLGDVAVFDNLGVHRGAMVEEGRRVAIFAVLA